MTVAVLRRHGWDAAFLPVAATVAYALKRFYSTAGSAELDFLLRPTAALVTLLSGHGFEHEPGQGYLSRDLFILIEPSCAGMNFLIIAFLTLGPGFLGRLRSPVRKGLWLLGCLGVAYAATLVVNAIRISLGDALRRGAIGSSELSYDTVHRWEGVVVYLGSLLLLSWLADGITRNRRARPWRLLAPPLGTYLGITLGVPLLNGAGAHAGFGHHAWVVLVLTATLGVLGYALFRVCRSGLDASPVIRRSE